MCASSNRWSCDLDEILRDYYSSHYFKILENNLATKSFLSHFMHPSSSSLISYEGADILLIYLRAKKMLTGRWLSMCPQTIGSDPNLCQAVGVAPDL